VNGYFDRPVAIRRPDSELRAAIFVAGDVLAEALAQPRQAGVTHTRIIAIITDAISWSTFSFFASKIGGAN
jgi:hypothetical protein